MENKVGGERRIEVLVHDSKKKFLLIFVISIMFLIIGITPAFAYNNGSLQGVTPTTHSSHLSYYNNITDNNLSTNCSFSNYDFVTYSFATPINIQSYYIRTSISGSINYTFYGSDGTTVIASGTQGVGSKTVTGAISNVGKIKIYNDCNTLSFVNEFDVYVAPAAPTTPTGLSITVNNCDSGLLTWSPNPTADNVTNYYIYKNGTLLTTQASTTYPLVSQSLGTSAYTIKAVNGNGLSQTSTAVNFIGSVPSKPSGLNITGNTLSWSTNPTSDYVTSYNVYLDSVYLATVSSGTTYNFSSLPTGSHVCQVSAKNDLGESALSTSSIIYADLPSVPTGLSVGNITKTSFTLYWTRQSDAASYNVYMDGNLVKNISQTLFYNPSLDISNLAEGSTHIMTVTAINQWGESTASQSLTVAPTLPSPVLKAIIDNKYIKLTWIGFGNRFDILVNNTKVTQTTLSSYVLTENPGTYQVQIIQNYNGQQYPSNIVSVTISALQNVGATQMTGDLLSSTGAVIAPVGGLLALALALKGSPMLLAAAKAFFLKS